MQRLPIAIEDALVAWVAAIHADATPFWADQDGDRPAAPFIELSVIAGPQNAGTPEERYKTTDTFTYGIRKRCTLNLQFFGEDALVRAAAVEDALGLPSRQALLQAAGIACWGVADPPRDITGFLDTRHEGRATLDLYMSYPAPVDDKPGEIDSVRVIGGIEDGDKTAITVDQTIDINA